MWRAPMPNPSGRLRIVSAASTAGQLSSGSPMPMKTTLVGLSAGFRSTISRTCPAISNGVRFRRNPIRPVAQKAHPRAQPAWDEMHRVRRPPEGMSTDSIASPSVSRHRYFRVPSARLLHRPRRRAGGGGTLASSSARSVSGSSVASPQRRRRLPQAPEHLAGPVAGQSALGGPGRQRLRRPGAGSDRRRRGWQPPEHAELNWGRPYPIG